MAGYLGYALQAGVQGFQTGTNLAQQKSEMDWQKKQRKKLEEAEAKLTEEATLYNSVVTQAGADNFFSEDEIMKINTTYLALGYRTQESLKSAHNALLTMDKAAFDREMEYFNGTIELLKAGLLDPKDATAVFEYGRNNWAISEKIKSLYEAADNIYAKSHGKLEEEKTWGRAEVLPSEARIPFLEQKGIEMPEVEPTTEALSVAERKYNWATEAYQKGLKGEPGGISFEEYKKYMGVSITPEKSTGLEKQVQDIITQGNKAGISETEINEAVKNKILGEGEITEPKPETVTTLKNWEAMFDIKSEEGPKTEEEYNRVLDLLAQSEDKYKPKYPTWKEALIAEVKGIAKDLEGISDKEDFNFLLNIYMQKLEEIKTKYPEVDLNQFSEFEEQKGWFERLKEKVGL